MSGPHDDQAPAQDPGQATGQATTSAPGHPRGPSAGDPYETLRVVLAREAERMQERRTELQHARAELLSLSAQLRLPMIGAGRLDDAMILPRASAHELSDLVRDLSVAVTGPLRLSIQRYPPDPALRREMSALVTDVPGGKQAVFPVSLLHEGGAQQWLGARALAGEEQRFAHEPAGQYLVIGSSAVVASARWNDPESDFVVLRDPMLVAAFNALFEASFRLGLGNPLGAGRTGVREQDLLALLGEGLKDETIARYLGVSLRTVRRRVASLMEDFGARTRFQLGMAAAELHPPASSGRRKVGSRVRHR